MMYGFKQSDRPVATDDGFVDVLGESELPPDTQKSVYVGLNRILLCNTETGIFAVEDKCSHAIQPLEGGDIEDGVITCPKHGACFDLKTGKPRNNLSNRPIKVFALRVKAGRIEVSVNPLSP